MAERLARRAGAVARRGRCPSSRRTAPATGQIFWYTVEGGGLDLGRLRAIQDWYVRPQLGSVPGVADVSSVGGFPIEYEVAPDPDRLRVFGVTLPGCPRRGRRVERRRPAATWSTRGTPSTSCGASAGWGRRPGPATNRSTRGARSATWKTWSCSAGAEGRSGSREVATVAIVPGFRRGVLEKDGNEVVGGVVLMAYGENPLEVTRRIKAKIRELQVGLPPGVRIVPFYDRTPLIEGAVAHGHRHGRGGDDLGIVVRPGDPAPRADVARHRRYAAARGPRRRS